MFVAAAAESTAVLCVAASKGGVLLTLPANPAGDYQPLFFN